MIARQKVILIKKKMYLPSWNSVFWSYNVQCCSQ